MDCLVVFRLISNDVWVFLKVHVNYLLGKMIKNVNQLIERETDRERGREKERKRGRERQTDRVRERQTERERKEGSVREKGTERDREREKERDRERVRWTEIELD